MNDVLKDRCNQPAFFSSVKYIVHMMDDDEKMADLILEICKINPYLGVDIYISSEENECLLRRLKNQLKNNTKSSALTKLQLSLSWNLLGDYVESVEELQSIFLSSDTSEQIKREMVNLRKIENFWKNLLYEMVVHYEYIDILPEVVFFFYLDNGNFSIADKAILRQLLQELYDKREYGRLLLLVDVLGLYGLIDSVVKDFNKFYRHVFSLYIHRKLKQYINYKQEGNAFSKLTALYLIRDNDATELLKILKTPKYKFRIYVGKTPLYFFINYYVTNFHGLKKEICISKKLKRMWSAELNATRYPINRFIRENEEAWWEGDCGHVWKRTIRDMKSNSTCPYCKSQRRRGR